MWGHGTRRHIANIFIILNFALVLLLTHKAHYFILKWCSLWFFIVLCSGLWKLCNYSWVRQQNVTCIFLFLLNLFITKVSCVSTKYVECSFTFCLYIYVQRYWMPFYIINIKMVTYEDLWIYKDLHFTTQFG